MLILINRQTVRSVSVDVKQAEARLKSSIVSFRFGLDLAECERQTATNSIPFKCHDRSSDGLDKG